MAEINVEQRRLIDQLKHDFPELKSYSDEQILTIYNEQIANIQLSEDEQISILSRQDVVSNDNLGLQIETTQTAELTAEQKNQLLSVLNQRINDVTTNTQKVKEGNGPLGKLWNWMKNTPVLDWCTDSTKDIQKAQETDLKALEKSNIKEIFEDTTGVEYTQENINKFLNNEIQTKSEQALNGYAEGQEMATDVIADIFSGILSVGIYTLSMALAPVTGGLSIAVGVAAATATGATVKTGIKALDTAFSEKEYTSDNFKKDMATGAFSGLLAPITGGFGGAIGKSVAKGLGIQAVKAGAGSVVEQTLKTGFSNAVKTALTNPVGYEYVGGSLVKRGLAFAAEAAADGAVGGAIDNAFRTAYDGGDKEDIWQATKQGFVGGAMMSPLIGGGMKLSGKLGGKIGKKVKDYSFNFSFSSVKAHIDYCKFKLGYDSSKNNKYWKSFDEINKTNLSRHGKYVDYEFVAYKKEIDRISREINDKYSTHMSYYEISDIIRRANDFIKEWNKAHYVEQELLVDLTPVQARFVDRILSSGRDKLDIIHTIANAKYIDTPANAYIREKRFLNDKDFSDLYYSHYLNECKTPEQVAFVLGNIRDSLSKHKVRYSEYCKTPEQLYLYSKMVKQAKGDSYSCAKALSEIKTEEDFLFVSELLSNINKINEKMDFELSNMIKLGLQDESLRPILKNLATFYNKSDSTGFIRRCTSYLGDKKTKEQAIAMIKHILSDKRLQEPEFLNKYSYLLLSCETKEEVECKIYALNYIFSRKNLCSDPEKMDKYLDVFLRAEKKAEIDAKIEVLKYVSSNKEFNKNKKLKEKTLDMIRYLSTPQEAKEKIICISGVLSNRKLNEIPDYIPWFMGFAMYDENAISAAHFMIKDMLKDKNFQALKSQDDGSDTQVIEAMLGWFYDVPTKKEILEATKVAKVALTNKYLANSMDILYGINAENKAKIFDIIKNSHKYQIPENRIKDIIKIFDNYDVDAYKSVLKRFGYAKIESFSSEEFKIALLFDSIYGKTNINEIPIYEKKEILRNLVAMNADLFKVDPEMAKNYPLLPKTSKEYCELLPTLVRSLGIETNYVHSSQLARFNKSLGSLSKTLEKISDTDFSNLTLTQSYPKDSFIKDVLRLVKDMPRNERQKVYDYFGFELHHNRHNDTGFSISGYPANLNNGKKLAQISDPQTKAIVEELRPYVVKFSEQNPIKCNNPQVEQLLNDIVKVLPEIRTAIGKKQHRTQKFDIMQHSLKVLQKISKDSGFSKLNESDKKIMILASILHDITKGEGYTDNTHAVTGSFDAYYICKKLRLTEDEGIKLYTLLKHHEWLEFVNTARDKDGKVDMELLTTRLQSVAYDLQQDNLFEMSLMFTHADLRAVKVDDSFHDKKVGAKGRTDITGRARSYGDLADDYAKVIRTYIRDLKASQPLLPHTTMPKASRVRRAITRVNSDGSTNLRGIYVDDDGLIIVKFNEATDKTWEAIGLPKGASSQADRAKIKTSKHRDEKVVDVGNINFIVHGLDYENQMVNFDAFALKDSDALLSVSYTERPRDKYRFFRKQGLTLKAKTKYIHGGGETDAGSGCKKSINDFKQNYVFGGVREGDRLYFSKLVKEATGMSDEEYIKFVQENADKPMYEIEPASVRKKVIKIYAEINSRLRKKGSRSYNECYVSNVEASAPFAYPDAGTVGNPVEFLKKKQSSVFFLRKYALEKDEVFIVFGD